MEAVEANAKVDREEEHHDCTGADERPSQRAYAWEATVAHRAVHSGEGCTLVGGRLRGGRSLRMGADCTGDALHSELCTAPAFRSARAD